MWIDIILINFVTIRGLLEPPKKTSPTQSSDKNAWSYASEGMQLAVTLLLGLYIGYKIDVRKGTLPWFTLAGATLGIVLGLYNFLKRFLSK